MTRENAVETFSNEAHRQNLEAMTSVTVSPDALSYHQRETNGDFFDRLDGPQNSQTYHLQTRNVLWSDLI